MDEFAEVQNMEHQFYQEGYQDGVAHGAMHGTFEGRALGREKGFEMWEEIGFYEGQAQLLSAYTTKPRTRQAVDQLLQLINAFPTSNQSQATESPETTDLTVQLNTIRSRYRTLCALEGVRPRVQAAQTSQTMSL